MIQFKLDPSILHYTDPNVHTLFVHSFTSLMWWVMFLCTSDKHHTNGEDLLGVSVGRHVTEAHAGQTAEGEVEWSDVDAPDGGPVVGPIHTSDGIVWCLQPFPQLVKPSWISII